MVIQVIEKEIHYPMHIEGVCSRFKSHCQSKKEEKSSIPSLSWRRCSDLVDAWCSSPSYFLNECKNMR
jgi:hypothetical protein